MSNNNEVIGKMKLKLDEFVQKNADLQASKEQLSNDIANCNSQIEELRAEIKHLIELNTDLDHINKDIEANAIKIENSKNKEIDDLHNKLSAIEAESSHKITSLESQLATVKAENESYNEEVSTIIDQYSNKYN